MMVRLQAAEPNAARPDDFLLLVESCSEGILRVDARGIHVYANRRAAELFGCAVEELIGRSIFDFYAGEELVRVKRNFAARRLGETGRSEYRANRKDGSTGWIAVSSEPVFAEDGTFLGVIAFVSDINERKRQEELAEQERRLLRRIAGNIPLADVLDDLCKTLESYSRQPLHCTVMLADIAGRRLECIAAPSLPEAFRNNTAITQLEAGDTPCAQAIRSGQPAIVPDTSVASNPSTIYEMRQAFGFGAVWSYPIIQDDLTLGTLLLLPMGAGVPDGEDGKIIEFALQVARLALAHERSTRALRESEERFRDFTELAADWYWEQDADFRFTEVSHGPGSRPALPPYYNASSIGKCRWELPYINVSGAFWEEHRRLLAARKPFIDLQLQRRDADGDIRTVEISGHPVFDAAGRFKGYRGVGRDITERVRAEARVRELNATLEQRVQARTAELEAANRELDAYNYSVSHDLRAPLRSVEGFSQALLEDHAAALDAAGRDYLQRICAAAQRMAVQIDAMYQLSRLTRSPLKVREVDLSARAQAVIVGLRHGEPARRADVHVEPGITAKGDPELLGIVLANLIGNAWKFSARAEPAQIAFGTLCGKDGNPVYFVRDNGAGFDMRFADKLFRLFQRLHREDEFAGHGVGLATTQRIVHRHGGRIWAEAAKGQGAVFYFSLWDDEAARRTEEADVHQHTTSAAGA